MGFFGNLQDRYGSRDIGIDLGTANVLVCAAGREGIVINEPSVVAYDTRTKKIINVGSEAQKMVGRTPENIKAIRPLKNGVIEEYEITQKMLEYFIRKASGDMFFHPRVMICVPGGISDVERRAVMDATMEAGARSVQLIEEPLAAAIGAGLVVNRPEGNLIVNIGGGITDVAVISLGGIVASESIRVGGDAFDEAIVRHVKNKYRVHIGERTAEQIKMRIGYVYEQKKPILMKVRGRCMREGLPKEITLSSKEMLEAMKDPIAEIIAVICRVVGRTPPELIPDILNNGITMTGGASKLGDLDLLLSDVTGIKAKVAKESETCVVKGIAKSLPKLSFDGNAQ